MSDTSEPGGDGSRRTVLIVVWVISTWFLSLFALALGRAWLLEEIVSQAARRGVVLSDCKLDLGLRSIGLDACAVSSGADIHVRGWPLAGVSVSGRVERIDVRLAGLSVERVQIRGAELSLFGEPRLGELFRSGAAGSSPGLPVDVERSAVSWSLDANATPTLLMSELGYSADTLRLSSRFEVVRRAQGQLSLGPEGLEVTLGDPSQPEVRFVVRVIPAAERAELSLDLRRLPLRSLEGPWLRLTDTLRPIELDGRIFGVLPLGLSTTTPGGDVYLTLHGLQFPVPRELDGLVYGSPPKFSGKFTAGRAMNTLTFADSTFLTGELAMKGTAEVELRGAGLAFNARMSGPLPCRAIAESAARAHVGSLLATLAGRIARRVLSGSVQVAAALEGHTSELDRAQVLTSIGVGCGLERGLEPRLPAPLLEVLPKQVRDRLPALDQPPKPGRLPKKRRARTLESPPTSEPEPTLAD